MLALLAFVRSPLGRYVLIGVAVLGLFLGLRLHWVGEGVKQEQRAEVAHQKAEEARVAAREQSSAAISTKAQDGLRAAQEGNQGRTRTLVQKVTVYVPAKADAGCTVPVGFVRLHDAAASGNPASLPAAPGGSVEAASGVPLSSALSTIIGNYGVAYDWRSEALTWRNWYAAQSAAWEKP